MSKWSQAVTNIVTAVALVSILFINHDTHKQQLEFNRILVKRLNALELEVFAHRKIPESELLESIRNFRESQL